MLDDALRAHQFTIRKDELARLEAVADEAVDHLLAVAVRMNGDLALLAVALVFENDVGCVSGQVIPDERLAPGLLCDDPIRALPVEHW